MISMEKKSANFSYRLNWMLLYYVAVLVEMIVATVGLLRSRIHEIMRSLYGPKLKGAEETIEMHKVILKKLPQHLAILLNDDSVLYEDVSNFIYWSMAVGVQHISIYDHKGDF